MSEFEELKNFAIADILSVSGKEKTARVIENHMNNIIEVSLIKGQEPQQAKIDELQKKYDAMYNAFVVADDCRKEWHESCINARKDRDELQARVDSAEKAIMICEEYDHAEKLNEIYNLLKGNKDEN